MELRIAQLLENYYYFYFLVAYYWQGEIELSYSLRTGAVQSGKKIIIKIGKKKLEHWTCKGKSLLPDNVCSCFNLFSFRLAFMLAESMDSLSE